MTRRLNDVYIDDQGQDMARAFAATLQRNLSRISDEEKPALVVTLRRKGWSYRRIAEALNIPYNQVSKILSDPSPAGSRKAAGESNATRATGTSTGDSSVDAVAETMACIDALIQGLDRLAAHANHAACQRDERLLTAVDALKAKLDGLKR